VLIEGMTIAGLATGATQGYIYLRWEYPDAKIALDAAIAAAYAGQYLGADIQGSGKSFDLEVRLGGGAYICGEETSLLESLEGKRGRCASSRRCPRSRDCSASPRSSQCHHARLGAHHPGSRRRALPSFRDGPLARHAAHSADGQHQSTEAWWKKPSASRCASCCTTTAADP